MTVFDRLGVELTPQIAEALYVGLVTDTGRFQYRTTSPDSLRIAARLVDAARTSTRSSSWSSRPCPGKTRLLGRVLEHALPYSAAAS